MNGHTDISVVMLTYNRMHLLSRAIASIQAQTFANFEFIIVDNGCTDESATVYQLYEKQDARIKIIRKARGNIGSGRNAGLDVAQGTYITFIDDDDIAEPDMLEFLYALITKHNAAIAVCGSTKEVEGQILPNCVFDDLLIMNTEQAVVELLKRSRINSANPTKLWHRSLFDKIRYSNHGNYDDITVIYKLFASADRVVAHGLPKYCFWRHPGNNSAFTSNDHLLTAVQLNEYFDAFRERTQYLSKKLPAIADYAQYSEWSYMISMCHKIISNSLTGCDKPLEYARMCLIEHYDAFYDSPYTQEFERAYMAKYIKQYRS